MQTFNLREDIDIFGFVVKDFPGGVGKAFDQLMAMVAEDSDRAYYGISYMDERGKVVYIAAVEDRNDGMSERNNCQKFTIHKGMYVAHEILNWMQDTGKIRDTFHEMIDQHGVDLTKPCIEWYKNDNEMVCMMKLQLSVVY